MRDALSEAIRSVILPRLVAARRARDIGLAHEGDRITEHDVAAMLADVLTPDQSVAEAMLTLLKLRGVSRTTCWRASSRPSRGGCADFGRTAAAPRPR